MVQVLLPVLSLILIQVRRAILLLIIAFLLTLFRAVRLTVALSMCVEAALPQSLSQDVLSLATIVILVVLFMLITALQLSLLQIPTLPVMLPRVAAGMAVLSAPVQARSILQTAYLPDSELLTELARQLIREVPFISTVRR